jgi:hypothetical protein
MIGLPAHGGWRGAATMRMSRRRGFDAIAADRRT